jgi:hypothetical protein
LSCRHLRLSSHLRLSLHPSCAFYPDGCCITSRHAITFRPPAPPPLSTPPPHTRSPLLLPPAARRFCAPAALPPSLCPRSHKAATTNTALQMPLPRCSPPPRFCHADTTANALLPPPPHFRALPPPKPRCHCRCRSAAAVAVLPPPPPLCRFTTTALLPCHPTSRRRRATAAASNAAAALPPPPLHCRLPCCLRRFANAATAHPTLPPRCRHRCHAAVATTALICCRRHCRPSPGFPAACHR